MQVIKKHEFWVLTAIGVGLTIAHEITEDATLAGIMGLVFLVATYRLAMHPMWKKDKQAADH